MMPLKMPSSKRGGKLRMIRTRLKYEEVGSGGQQKHVTHPTFSFNENGGQQTKLTHPT